MNNWYKDRDFPEVKASNDDIVAVIEDPKQLERVIKDQNALVDAFYELHNKLYYAEVKIQELQQELERLRN
jgi:hypothetical protein